MMIRVLVTASFLLACVPVEGRYRQSPRPAPRRSAPTYYAPPAERSPSYYGGSNYSSGQVQGRRRGAARPAICNCVGYNGPGGPCYDGPGGPAYSGPGAPAYAGPGGPCYSGPGGPMYGGPGGPTYNGPGGNCYSGPGGPAYAGPGGPCNDGPGGACYSGPGGGWNCPQICQICGQ